MDLPAVVLKAPSVSVLSVLSADVLGVHIADGALSAAAVSADGADVSVPTRAAIIRIVPAKTICSRTFDRKLGSRDAAVAASRLPPCQRQREGEREREREREKETVKKKRGKGRENESECKVTDTTK